MGPEGPDEVGCVGWGQLTKDSEGSIHGTLENGLQGQRCHASKLTKG